MGKIFYIMGKSASGKDRMYKRLLADETLHLQPLVLYTTRPVRSGETDGVTYHFSDLQELKRLQDQGKVIESRTYQTVFGPWYYFTVDDGQIEPGGKERILAIGTPESFVKIRDRYGADHVIPLYIEMEDGARLAMALKRERKQEHPAYAEMCRRFLADEEDFSEEKHGFYHVPGIPDAL